MINFKIYNSFGREKQDFVPINPGKIGMYVCGPTVYDLCHMGNARTFATFDTIVRFLRFAGWEVKYVRNITDVDDKIIARANQNGESINSLTTRMIAEMHKDFAALNMQKPDAEPRATEYIQEIIDICKQLENGGYAYINSQGDLLFRVLSFEDYGKLSRQNLEQLEQGTRVDANYDKESSLDFVLWKLAKPGEPSWDSPWGAGRPGWHIECSAMNAKELGTHFDIHGGGNDLQFPHHENEIAQSCCVHQNKFVNYWLHTGMVMVDKEKMSKSLNNFFMTRQLLGMYDNEVVRFFLSSSHYRSDVNYTTENLEVATKSLERLYTALQNNCDEPLDKVYTYNDLVEDFKDNQYLAKFTQAMSDDFNASEGVAVMFELVREINSSQDSQYKAQLAKLLRALGNIFGILFKSTQEFFNATDGLEVSAEYIESLIQARKEARANKDWVKADQVRDELNRLNIILEDGVNGTTWKVKK